MNEPPTASRPSAVRVPAGQAVAASWVPTDLAAFTAGIVASFRPLFASTARQLVADCPSLGLAVPIDATAWENLLHQLLWRAWRDAPAHETKVTLRAGDGFVELAVRYPGPATEKNPEAGEPAPAGPAIPMPLAGETGSLQELAAVQGGRLAVKDEPDGGRRFSVTLPRDIAAGGGSATANRPGMPGNQAATQAAAASFAFAGADTMRAGNAGTEGTLLLLVADSDLRQYVALLFARHFHVLLGADAAATLEAVGTHAPDFVVADSVGSAADGFLLVRAIRSKPEWRAMPVIVLGSPASTEGAVEALEAGADDYVPLPFRARELLARVSAHLHLARLRTQAQERERELRTNAEIFARALRESSERLSASLAAAGTGTFRWDVESNALDWDESLERLFGLAPAANTRSLGQFLQLIHPDDRGNVRQAFERCARTGVDFAMEFRVPLPDGSVRWLDEKGKIFFGPNGQPLYMIGACVDVSKRKQMEAFVWRQKDVLGQIVHGAALGDVLEALTLDVEQVAERDLHAIILMVDATGKHLRFAAGRRAPALWRRAIDGVAIGPAAGSFGAAAHRKERVVVPDIGHHPLWTDYRAEAIKLGIRACWSTPIVSSSGNVLGTFDVYYPEPGVPKEQELKFIDIATQTAAIAVERDRAEGALRESRAKLADYAQTLERRVTERTARLQETISELESFSYSISHDMRAPLRAMQSFAQILADECGEQLSAEGKDYLRRIIGASDRMDRLIHDVLIYSRVARAELKLEPVDVGQLLAGILESYPQFQPPLATIELAPALPVVLGNSAALTQCFSNLLGNAVKFVAPGVHPHVKIWSVSRGDRTVIYIRDNGIGIEPNAREKIFHIFYQLDRTFEGTGIGLSVVRKAAERMGGTVGVDSEPGKGSTFYLELRLAPQ